MACLSSILFASKSNFRLCEQGKAGDFPTECRLDVNFDVVNLEINYHYHYLLELGPND